MKRAPLIVLAIDDSEDDLELLSMAFRKSAPDVIARFVGGGEAGLSYMRGEGKYADRSSYPLPDLILLDLKMPRVNGFQVLEQVRAMTLKQPYIVMLTSSNLHEDMQKAKELQVDLFQTKSSDFSSLCTLLARIIQFFEAAPPRLHLFRGFTGTA